MAALVLAVSFFTAVYIGYKPKLQILALHALYAAQGIFGVPNFAIMSLLTELERFSAKPGTEHSKKKDTRRDLMTDYPFS